MTEVKIQAGQPSYDHGASSTRLIGDTIGQAFDKTVTTYATQDALVVVEQGIRWTWQELGARVQALAAGFLALGLELGDRVGIWAPNCSEWVLTQFATAKVGLILVNINPAYRRAELAYALNKVGCKALVLAPALKSTDYLAIMADLVPELTRAIPCEPTPIYSPTMVVWATQLPSQSTYLRTGTFET